MRYLVATLSFCATVAFYVPAAAQEAPAPTAAPMLANAPRYSMEDTMRAVQHLFMRRTRGAEGWASSGGGLVANAALRKAVLRRRSPEWRRQQDNGDLLIGGLMLGYGLWKMARFGPEQCETVLVAYEQGQPLPEYVRRRLKPRFFRY